MRRRHLTTIALACASTLASPLAGPLAAQRGAPAIPNHALTRTDAHHAEPFTTVSGVRELADGRVVVVDRGEKSIQLLDLTRGTATRLGREGGGPNEYRQPTLAFPMPGDSTLVFDMGNMRYMVVASDGAVVRTFSTIDPQSGSMRLLLARAADGAGNIYFLDRGLSMTPGGAAPVAQDSGTVLRYDPRTGQTAEVARVGLPNTQINASGSANQRQVMVRSVPFSAQDDWTAGLDGRIAVVRTNPYRVEWVAPSGQRVVGPTVAYQPLKVTEKDKEAWRQQSQAPGAGFRVVVGGSAAGGQAPAPMTTTARVAEPDRWPEVKPPFLGNAATVATDGRLWVQRTTAAGDAPRFDVFDSFGKVVANVTLPAATRLVGFGRGTVYVVRKDENDLEYLERYRMP